METAEKFRQYAQECRLLAQKAAPKDKTALLEIAEAWERHANDTARNEKGLIDGAGDFRDDPTPLSR